jgi:hypothetical protein
MNSAIVDAELQALAAVPGIRACALVDVTSGLVFGTAGTEPPDASLWEAAAEYWRLHGRLKSRFEPLGALGAAVLQHKRGALVVMPCPAGAVELVIACVAIHKEVDWKAWQRRLREFGDKLGSS